MDTTKTKSAFGFSCALCGEEVTCPYFHNGKVYGYTCIKKVGGKAKKSKGIWYPARVTLETGRHGQETKVINILSIGGQEVKIVYYRIGKPADMVRFVPDGAVQLTDEKGNCFFSNFHNTVEGLFYKGQRIQ